MNLLAIDTSTDYLSLAVLKDGKVLAKYHKKASMRHSILLVPMIDKLLKKARLKIREIDCFAISIGPGSFTGLRIGVTVVKGLAYALKKPVIAVPTLDAIAMNAKKVKGTVCVILDARKKKVYACFYRADGEDIKKISPYLLLSLDDLLKKIKKYGKVFFLGDYPTRAVGHRPGVVKDRPAFVFKDKTTQYFGGHIRRSQSGLYAFKGEGGWHPRAEVIGALALEDFKKKKFVSAADLEPMYIYSKECDITGR